MIGNSFDTPMMYQDLANSTMPPVNLPLGGYYGTYNTSYLGGVQMQRQLDRDKVNIMQQKEQQDNGTMKKVLAAFVIILGLGAIGPVRKGIRKAGGIIPYIKKLWNEPTLMKTISKSLSSFGNSVKHGVYNITVKPFKALGQGIKKLFKR